MAKLIVLGSASAVPTAEHENTHFVLKGEGGSVLVDCTGSPLIRLERAGVAPDTLSDIILTHCHPDHISAVPSLLMSLWLMGRKESLGLHGLQHTLGCIQKMMELYEWEDWPNFFPVNFHPLPSQPKTLVLENADFHIYASPVNHIIPTIGLRIESVKTDKVISYSCDTEPCSQMVELAKNADILLHEATGASYGHSSAAQAGGVAREAGAKSLYLIHYPPHLYESQELIREAGVHFSGEVKFSKDFLVLEL
jgi:ribonuclease Z